MTVPHAVPRRKDRWVQDEDWMRSMLSASLFCTVGTVQDGWAYQRPSAYYYDPDEHAVYIHGAHQGQAFGNAGDNAQVTICVYDVGAFRTHSRAFEFFQEHAGLMAFGRASVETDNATKHRVMQAMFVKHAPHLTVDTDYEPASQEEIDETTVLKITIEHWSGKMKWTDDPERPRYRYNEVPIVRPNLPWHDEAAGAEPMNAEWRQSVRISD